MSRNQKKGEQPTSTVQARISLKSGASAKTTDRPPERTHNLEQVRAQFAWARLDAKRPPDGYRELAKSAPAMVMTSGLMQTLAFLQAKSKGVSTSKHGALREHLTTWLAHERVGVVSAHDFNTCMTDLHGSTAGNYRRATEEALEILRWLRQFADALNLSDKEDSA